MFDKLQVAEDRYEEISHKLSDPDVISNQDEYKKLMKEFADLEEIVQKFREYKKITSDVEEARALLDENLEKEFHEMVQHEFQEAQEKLENIKKQLKIMLVPKDPMMIKTLLLKYEEVPAAKRLHYLQVFFSEL